MTSAGYHIQATLLLAVPVFIIGFLAGLMSPDSLSILILGGCVVPAMIGWFLPRFPWGALAIFLYGWGSAYNAFSPPWEMIVPWTAIVMSVIVTFAVALKRPAVTFDPF